MREVGNAKRCPPDRLPLKRTTQLGPHYICGIVRPPRFPQQHSRTNVVVHKPTSPHQHEQLGGHSVRLCVLYVPQNRTLAQYQSHTILLQHSPSSGTVGY